MTPEAGASVAAWPIGNAEDRLAEAAGGRGSLLLVAFMLFVSALPDAMVVPLLNELFVQRYGVSAAAAHWFMSINLMGALAALPALWVMRRRWTPAAMIMVCAAANAALLLAMWLPVGFGATMALRLFEGGADLVVFAVLFDLFAKAGDNRSRGRRLGLAGMVLMFGLFAGAVAGGRLGIGRPVDVFLLGAMACLVVALAAVAGGRNLSRLIMSCPAVGDDGAAVVSRRPLWPALAMIASDRAIAGLMTATFPLFFATVAGLGPAARGWLIGVPLLCMALGAWPAGWLGDRMGHGRVRMAAAGLYAVAIAALPAAATWTFAASLSVMALIGLAGAALLPTSLAVAAGSGRGSIAMGAHRSAGDVGYLLGIVAAGTMLGIIGGDEPGLPAYTTIIVAFAGFHLFVTAATAVGLETSRRTAAPRMADEDDCTAA